MEGVIPSYKVDELFSVKDKVTLITGMGQQCDCGGG